MLYRLKSFIKKVSPKFIISGYHFLIAFLAALIYGFPGRKIKIIGVTGTNGKSTVIQMFSQILEEVGFKAASLSSIRFRINGKDEINDKRMTMPGRFFVQRFLARAVKAGCQYAILEVTSEGIIQFRHCFINFEAAVFTNLTPEHIESHGSFENYRTAKGKFFKAVKNIHILNLDDENIDYFRKFEAKKKWGYGIKISDFSGYGGPAAGWQSPIIKAENIEALADGSRFIVDGLDFRIGLLGEFNVYNALAAITIARSQNIGLKICQRALAQINSLPGRMELVVKEPFRVFVDYAFTPNALEKVYSELKARYISRFPNASGSESPVRCQPAQNTRMICVFGSCGGGRDKWKRPVLGKIAANYCDQIILTNEDPYDENPSQILSGIKSGIENSGCADISSSGKRINCRSLTRDLSVAGGKVENLHEILDRREAIVKALNLAEAGDVVVVTGKGCEPSICLAGGKQIPWDDREVVREEFKRLSQNTMVKN